MHRLCGSLQEHLFFYERQHKVLKRLVEGEYKSEGVLINRHTVSQSHHWTRCSETAVPITGKHDNNRSANGKDLLQEIVLL